MLNCYMHVMLPCSKSDFDPSRPVFNAQSTDTFPSFIENKETIWVSRIGLEVAYMQSTCSVTEQQRSEDSKHC